MIEFPQDHRIVGIACAEIRLNLMGPQTGTMARLAFVDGAGMTCGEVRIQNLSPRSHALVRQLAESIELDASEVFENPRLPPEPGHGHHSDPGMGFDQG